jgi:hypothetical protein
MPQRVHLDECVNRHLADLLRADGIDVTTATETQTLDFDDESQLLFATRDNCLIVTHNQRHFQRLDTQFRAEQRPHGGVMLIPNGPLNLVHLRAKMLLAWVESRGSPESQLVRWHDLQAELTSGSSFQPFTPSEIRQALALSPLDQ